MFTQHSPLRRPLTRGNSSPLRGSPPTASASPLMTSAAGAASEPAMTGLLPIISPYGGARPKQKPGHMAVSSLGRVISYQGCLARFLDPTVRYAFLAGRLDVRENSEDMLSSIDLICKVVLPSPYRASRGDVTAEFGADLFLKLLEEDDHQLLQVNDRELPIRKTCGEWSRYFAKISASPYWDDSPTRLSGEQFRENRKSGAGGLAEPTFPIKRDGPPADSLVNDDEISYPTKTRIPVGEERETTKMFGKTQYSRPLDLEFDDCLTELSLRDRINAYPRRRSVKAELPERGLSPSRFNLRDRSSRSRWNDKRDQSSDDDDQYDDYRNKELFRMLSNIRQPKEAVSPGTFSGKESTSLRVFLEDFENYFHIKYDGNERQQSQLLGQHLDGSAKQAYDAMDGRRLHYSLLKPELLNWYSGERSSIRNKNESEFRKARMMPNDSLKIFAMRLERLATVAFADSWKEQDRQLCRKFRKCVPEGFRRVLAEGERSLALYGKQRKLDWSNMLKLAESEDRHRRERKEDQSTEGEESIEDVSVWYSRPDVSIPPQPRASLPNAVGEKTGRHVTFDHVNEGRTHRPQDHDRVFQNTSRLNRGSPSKYSGRGDRRDQPLQHSFRGNRGSPPSRRGTIGYRSSSTPLICEWCGRCGHTEKNCWTKSNSCLICGSSEHHREACPKFLAEWNGFKPCCSRCRGTHLGMDCPERPLN